MKREIVKNWYIGYFNQSNEYHREGDKPSYISFNGFISFCKNDKDNRKDKPSVIWNNGALQYYENYKFVKSVNP